MRWRPRSHPSAAHGAVARTGVTAPCWKLLLNDWYDGTINKIYPIPCYQQAINHLPADLRIYGSATRRHPRRARRR